MTTITKKIDLNVSQPNNYQLVHAMQGDSNTVEIIATIWNGNKLYNIDCDQISLEWQSPSGGKRDYPIAEHTQYTVTFLLKKEMLVENGDYAFCIRFDNSNSDVLRTFCSTMRVMRAPFGQLMDSEVVTLTELIGQAKNYKEQAALSAANAENFAKQAQSYAIGTGGARPNESTDSAKYYYKEVKDIYQGLSDSFMPINTVTNGNFDNVIKTGFYKMIDSSNAPTNNNIHSLLVCDSTDGLDVSIQQIALPIKSNTIYIRYRHRISLSTVPWSEWVHIPYSAVAIGALPITGGTLTGDLRIKGDGNYGTKINLGDGDYIHFSESKDDCLEIKANEINFLTDITNKGFTLNGVELPRKSDVDSLKDTINNVKGSVTDSHNGNNITFSYGNAGLDYGNYTWLAAWNGYELRAVNKNQFAPASHSHDYSSLNGRYVLHTATVDIQSGTSAFNGYYASGGAVTVGSFSELVVLSTNCRNGWATGWSYSGTTLSISVFKSGSSTTTATVYYFTR